MATAQNLLLDSFGYGFVCFSTENSSTDLYETNYLYSMHALEDYKVLGIDIQVLHMKWWTPNCTVALLCYCTLYLYTSRFCSKQRSDDCDSGNVALRSKSISVCSLRREGDGGCACSVIYFFDHFGLFGY